jgi:hypothetical protein
MNNHTNFADALLREQIKKEEIKKPTTLTELSNSGWTILKRINKKNTILRPFNEQFYHYILIINQN